MTSENMPPASPKGGGPEGTDPTEPRGSDHALTDDELTTSIRDLIDTIVATHMARERVEKRLARFKARLHNEPPEPNSEGSTTL